MIEFNENLWIDQQYEVLLRFIHHLAYYKILREQYNTHKIKSEFWKYTIDAHLERAIVDWCMIFGTNSSELHWKKVILSDKQQNSFRCFLLSALSISNKKWEEYHREIVDFRNDYIAHNNSHVFPVPFMDNALKTVITYDRWLRKYLINAQILLEEPLLNERYERIKRNPSTQLLSALMQGPTIEQEYERKK